MRVRRRAKRQTGDREASPAILFSTYSAWTSVFCVVAHGRLVQIALFHDTCVGECCPKLPPKADYRADERGDDAEGDENE